MQNIAVILSRGWSLEGSLMNSWVKFLWFSLHQFGWIKSLQAMLLQSIHDDLFRHPETIIKVGEILVLSVCQFIGWNSFESTLKVVNGLN